MRGVMRVDDGLIREVKAIATHLDNIEKIDTLAHLSAINTCVSDLTAAVGSLTKTVKAMLNEVQMQDARIAMLELDVHRLKGEN